MPGSQPAPGDIFDVRKIRRLVELMKEHDLAEIDLREADTRIRLRRGPDQTVSVVEPRTVHVPAPSHSPPPAAAASQTPPPAADKNYAVIKSPMVGTFYTSPNPESPPFVKVGDHVGAETTVCIIEAMKVFNDIPAEMSGKIIAVLVDTGEPVEYGQPLFRVDAGK